MTIIRFSRHKLHRCKCDESSDFGCFVCEGGLASCDVCGGAEGSMPTDCPGQDMTPEQADAVYAGTLDYRRREGWVKIAKKMQQGY